MILFQIIANHFCAGGECNDKKIVVRQAPIIKYIRLWTIEKVEKYCLQKGWKFKRIIRKEKRK